MINWIKLWLARRKNRKTVKVMAKYGLNRDQAAWAIRFGLRKIRSMKKLVK